MYEIPATAASQPYGFPERPLAISYSQAPSTARMSTSPESAVAWTSIFSQRSSRPGPPRPCSVSLRRPNRKTAPMSAITAKDAAPSPGLPPMVKAAKMRAPRNRQNPGIHQRLRMTLRMCVGMEDLLHARPEEARQRDGQRQGRRVALFLDGVDGLARDGHGLRELLLREARLGPEGLDLVAHDDVKLACHRPGVKHALHRNSPGASQAAPTGAAEA